MIEHNDIFSLHDEIDMPTGSGTLKVGQWSTTICLALCNKGGTKTG